MNADREDADERLSAVQPDQDTGPVKWSITKPACVSDAAHNASAKPATTLAVIGFEREQAIADDLQMLFGFGLEEFQNLVGNIVVLRQ